MKGRASSKAFPNLCSSIIPLKAVKRTITISPIKPTEATLKAKDKINIITTENCTINFALSLEVLFKSSSLPKFSIIDLTSLESSAP